MAACHKITVTMKVHSILKTCSAVALVLSSLARPETLTATICVDHKLKPLKHVCGIVVDFQGTPIPNAKVAVLRSGTEIASSITRVNGEFSFGKLEADEYEIKVEATGFGELRSAFVIAKPAASCKQMLRIQVSVGTECSHVRLIKRPPSEAGAVRKMTHTRTQEAAQSRSY